MASDRSIPVFVPFRIAGIRRLAEGCVVHRLEELVNALDAVPRVGAVWALAGLNRNERLQPSSFASFAILYCSAVLESRNGH